MIAERLIIRFLWRRYVSSSLEFKSIGNPGFHVRFPTPWRSLSAGDLPAIGTCSPERVLLQANKDDNGLNTSILNKT